MRRVVSLYTGVGGLDLGREAAGFDVAVAVDPDAVVTLRANRDWPILEEAVQADRGGGDKSGSSSALAGSASPRRPSGGRPPLSAVLQGFVLVSGDSRRLKNSTYQYARTIPSNPAGALPEAFLLENVPGLRFRAKDEGLV